MLKGRDILVLLKVAASGGQAPSVRSLGAELALAPTSVQDSLKRLRQQHLLSQGRGIRLNRLQAIEFLAQGLRWVIPGELEEIALGLPTARSAEPLKGQLLSDGETLIMPLKGGPVRGRAVKPIAAEAPAAAEQDPALHTLLALSDAIRIGDARSRELAVRELRAAL